MVLSLLIPLKSENCKYHGVTCFMDEQIRLMTQSIYSYSYDYLVFASVFLQHCTTGFSTQVATVFCHVTT